MQRSVSGLIQLNQRNGIETKAIMSIYLKYIKKGPVLLKDTQKVFFCSTKADREKFFEEISSDLFEIQDNISIWYKEEDAIDISDEERKEYLSDLSEMALFVVPVTGDFLKTENDARRELDHAIKENIPILPILEEQGLEFLFNDVCGNLQILNKHDPDPTALPYKDKLKLFLDTVLLKDEMLEKIRKAFAAYIFLSYRKKDRRYAQEVMRLIHKDPFTRDIAIWYDEFLTPGEDFNESIKEAFEKSDLFSMVVTPNLLEKPNYVMTTEYPMAVKAGKKILPLQAVDTDGEALTKDYPGIPEPVKAEKDNIDRIDELIKDALKIETNDDPLHKFFIGLAYLSGIDMDIDHEKARNLITDAAEGGIEEAYQKLVSVYELGQGADRDYEKAAIWQEKYAGCLKKKLDDNDTDEDLRYRYIRTVNAAAAKWRDLLKYDRCWDLLEEMMALDTEGMTEKEKTALAESFQYAAEFANWQKDFHRARTFLNKMLAISEEFIASIRKDELEKTNKARHSDLLQVIYRGLAMNILGDIEAKEGNWSEALKCYEEAEPLIRRVFAANPEKNQGHAKTVAELYGKLGQVYFKIDEESPEGVKKADRKCREGLLFTEGLRNQLGEFTQGPYIFKIYQTLVEMYNQKKNYWAADKTADEFMAIVKKEDEETGTINSARLLAFAHTLKASIAEGRKEYAKAETEVMAAVDIEKSLQEKIGITNIEKQLKNYYRILEGYASKTNDVRKAAFYADNIRYVDSQVALKYYRDAERGNKAAAAKAYELYQKLHEKYPDRDYGKNANYVKNHFMKH